MDSSNCGFFSAGRLAVVVLAACLGSTAAQALTPAAKAKPMLVDDFQGVDGLSRLGERWAEYSDSYTGGASKIKPTVVTTGKDANKAMRLNVTFGRGFAYPFGGVQTFLQKGGVPKDLRGYTGIKLRTRGEYVYTVRLLQAQVTDYNEFAAEVESKAEWTEVRIPFTQFAQSPFWGKQLQFDASGIRGVGIQVPGIPGSPPVELLIDDISFY